MKLEPVFAEDTAPLKSGSELRPDGTVTIHPSVQAMLGITLVPVQMRSSDGTVATIGRVLPEDTRVYRLNAGVDGFVRATYGDAVGTFVRKDQRLASYYAPEFLSAASGFLAASERVPGAVAKEGARSIQNYTDRLRNLGMSDVQIKRMADSRQLPDTIDLVSPADGFILSRNISAGEHFQHDAEFYKIADLGRVWVVAELYEQDIPHLRVGSAARILLREHGRTMTARITDSLPASDAGGGTVKLRLEVDNPSFLLRPEMLVNVYLPVRSGPGLTVPLDAIVDNGAAVYVYVAQGENSFARRQVSTGRRSGERVEIQSGLHVGERVVSGATFLVDSEARLRSRIGAPATPPSPNQSPSTHAEGAVRTAKDPNCGMSVDRDAASGSGNTFSQGKIVYYFCSRKCKESFQANLVAQGSRHQGDDD
jgi:multidrug efflux pump subunit AcrA (membrane-fusion protein)/YHS domain-containing protein